MVKFEGKYELEKSENFVEYLKSLGQNLSDEEAKKLREERTILIVEVEGERQYKFSNKTGSNNHVLSFTIGKPFQETVQGITLDDIAEQKGNIITVTSSIGERKYERIYSFSDTGVVEALQSPESNIVAKQHFKRV